MYISYIYGFFPLKHAYKLQNHRMFEVGRNLWRPFAQIPHLSMGTESHIEVVLRIF